MHEGSVIDNHFRHVSKMVHLGSGAERDIGDIELTRRARYLIGTNGDPRKKAAIAAVTAPLAVPEAAPAAIRDLYPSKGKDPGSH